MYYGVPIINKTYKSKASEGQNGPMKQNKTNEIISWDRF